MSAVLSELKISSLENKKREVKKKYQDWLQSYMVTYLGQPLEKVQVCNGDDDDDDDCSDCNGCLVDLRFIDVNKNEFNRMNAFRMHSLNQHL